MVAYTDSSYQYAYSLQKSPLLIIVLKVFTPVIPSKLVINNGILLACCNTSTFSLSNFKSNVRHGVLKGGRKIIQSVHSRQPIDFPSSAEEPAYLKAYWLRLN